LNGFADPGLAGICISAGFGMFIADILIFGLPLDLYQFFVFHIEFI
jgi:hypothetical protein